MPARPPTSRRAATTTTSRGDVKSAKTLNLVTPILIGVGGAMLIGGIVMIVIDRGNKKKGKGFYANQRPRAARRSRGGAAAGRRGGWVAGAALLSQRRAVAGETRCGCTESCCASEPAVRAAVVATRGARARGKLVRVQRAGAVVG
jgi:hypothetical protein